MHLVAAGLVQHALDGAPLEGVEIGAVDLL
jgi:hypothetical protein